MAMNMGLFPTDIDYVSLSCFFIDTVSTSGHNQWFPGMQPDEKVRELRGFETFREPINA